MMRYTLLLFALIFQFSAAKAQEVTATLDRDQIKIGEQTTIDLTLRFPAAEKTVMLPALQDTITKFVEVIAVSDVDTTFDEDDITTKIFEQQITVTSWDSGYHVIPPFKFVIGNDTLESKPLLLQVSTVTIAGEQDIKDIKKIIEVPFSLWDWILTNRLLVGLVFLAIVLVVLAVVLYRRYKNRLKEEAVVVVPKEAADKVARRKLEELESKKLWQNDKTKAYYSELSFVVREYIENRFLIPALEQTTDETITSCSIIKEISKDELKKLHQTLLLADMAKFAKQKPNSSENEIALQNSYSLIEKTAVKEEELAMKEEDTKDGTENA